MLFMVCLLIKFLLYCFLIKTLLKPIASGKVAIFPQGGTKFNDTHCYLFNFRLFFVFATSVAVVVIIVVVGGEDGEGSVFLRSLCFHLDIISASQIRVVAPTLHVCYTDLMAGTQKEAE